MSKRYGRNQKRRAMKEIQYLRDTVKQLSCEVDRLLGENIRLRRAASTADSAAFDRYARNHELYALYVEKIGYALGEHLAHELEGPAREILRRQGEIRDRATIRLTSGTSPVNSAVQVMRGEIPSIRYNIAFDMRLHR